MTTIDKLDIGVYNRYAIHAQLLEAIQKELKLPGDNNIQAHTQIVDISPKLTELDLLLGIIPLNTPWAYFFPPKEFRRTRRSPFAFYRVAPTLGSLEEQERLVETLENTPCNTPEEKRERDALANCFSQLDKLNEWLGFIVGRVGQFLQG